MRDLLEYDDDFFIEVLDDDNDDDDEDNHQEDEDTKEENVTDEDDPVGGTLSSAITPPPCERATSLCEVVLLISNNYLSLHDLSICCQVSRSWNDAFTPILWRRVVLTPHRSTVPVPTPTLLHAIATTSNTNSSPSSSTFPSEIPASSFSYSPAFLMEHPPPDPDSIVAPPVALMTPTDHTTISNEDEKKLERERQRMQKNEFHTSPSVQDIQTHKHLMEELWFLDTFHDMVTKFPASFLDYRQLRVLVIYNNSSAMNNHNLRTKKIDARDMGPTGGSTNNGPFPQTPQSHLESMLQRNLFLSELSLVAIQFPLTKSFWEVLSERAESLRILMVDQVVIPAEASRPFWEACTHVQKLTISSVIFEEPPPHPSPPPPSSPPQPTPVIPMLNFNPRGENKLDLLIEAINHVEKEEAEQMAAAAQAPPANPVLDQSALDSALLSKEPEYLLELHFPYLKCLTLRDPQGMNLFAQVDIIGRCPNLISLEWKSREMTRSSQGPPLREQVLLWNKFFRVIRDEKWPTGIQRLILMVTPRLPEPNPVGNTPLMPAVGPATPAPAAPAAVQQAVENDAPGLVDSENILTDEILSWILYNMPHKTFLNLAGSLFGPQSYKVAFRKCPYAFLNVHSLSFRDCPNIHSGILHGFMANCNTLEYLEADVLRSVDVREDGRPWRCKRLKTLRVDIVIPRWDAGVGEHQLYIFNLLSELTELQVLDLAISQWRDLNPNNNIQEEDWYLHFTTQSGLDILKTLIDLRELSLKGSWQRLEHEDILWMIEHWPKVKIFGWLDPNYMMNFFSAIREAKRRSRERAIALRRLRENEDIYWIETPWRLKILLTGARVYGMTRRGWWVFRDFVKTVFGPNDALLLPDLLPETMED